jgi:hypothetical protein
MDPTYENAPICIIDEYAWCPAAAQHVDNGVTRQGRSGVALERIPKKDGLQLLRYSDSVSVPQTQPSRTKSCASITMACKAVSLGRRAPSTRSPASTIGMGYAEKSRNTSRLATCMPYEGSPSQIQRDGTRTETVQGRNARLHHGPGPIELKR